MSSWGRNNIVKQRIFRTSNQIENVPYKNNSNNINETLIYEPYYFNYSNGSKLVEKIKEFSRNNLNKITKIINVYQPLYKNRNATGLGDFIRGSIFLYQYCKIANIDFEMNMCYHPINSILDNDFIEIKTYFLKNIEHSEIINYHPTHYNNQVTDINVYESELNKINEYLSNCIINENGLLYTCMKTYPLFNITEDEKKFIRLSLNYNILFKNSYDNFKRINKLELKSFNIIHIRNGDTYLKNELKVPSNDYVENICKLIGKRKINGYPYVLISDSKIVENLISKKYADLITFDNTKNHFGEGINCSFDDVNNNMLEFYLMSESIYIYSLSVYQHGSGFSKWCAEIFNIPYTNVYIKSIS